MHMLGGCCAHPAAKLIQLAKPKTIGVKNNQCIGAGNVQAAFNDGGAEQHVVVAIIEVHHHVFQTVFLHLAMRNANARLRHQCPQALIKLLNGVHTVVQKIYLSAAGLTP